MSRARQKQRCRPPEPSQALRAIAMLVLAATPLVASGCIPSEPTAGAAGAAGPRMPAAGGEVELAALMGDLQRFSAKLGYALSGENMRLADFYLHEIAEVRELLVQVEEHDAMPIAEPTQIILTPAIESLAAALAEVDLARAQNEYEVLVEACNRCHAATEHEFLVITPARGQAPFNQDFAAIGLTE